MLLTGPDPSSFGPSDQQISEATISELAGTGVGVSATQATAERLSPPRRCGLVLGGGTAPGAFQAGVLKRLYRACPNPDIITTDGSTIGALRAAMLPHIAGTPIVRTLERSACVDRFDTVRRSCRGIWDLIEPREEIRHEEPGRYHTITHSAPLTYSETDPRSEWLAQTTEPDLEPPPISPNAELASPATHLQRAFGTNIEADLQVGAALGAAGAIVSFTSPHFDLVLGVFVGALSVVAGLALKDDRALLDEPGHTDRAPTKSPEVPFSRSGSGAAARKGEAGAANRPAEWDPSADPLSLARRTALSRRTPLASVAALTAGTMSGAVSLGAA